MEQSKTRDKEHEKRVLELLESALSVSPGARAVHLDAACGGDAELRARVDALLALHEQSARFLDLGSIADRSPPGGHSPVSALLDARPELARLFNDVPGAEPPVGEPASESAAPPGGDCPRYSDTQEIARGGMGIIYRVWDRVLRRSLALKVIRPAAAGSTGTAAGPAAVVRFLVEARITAQLDHPGVVPLYDLGQDPQGRVFFTMRLVEGLELGEVFCRARDRKDGWSPTRALGVLVRVCETLAYAHSKHVIHRDLKPQNIMVGRYGETYVMDWGLAKFIGVEDCRDLRPGDGGHPGDDSPDLVTRDGTVVGTPCFMPPEQAEGSANDLDHRADIYAVGAMLYTLLAGHMPYAAPGKSSSHRQVLVDLRRGPPEPLRLAARDAPAELVAICEKAMARDRAGRYQSMDVVAEDLRAYLENRVVKAHRTGALVELRKWMARNRGTAAALACTLVLLIAGVVSSQLLLSRVTSERDAKRDALTRLEVESKAKGAALSEKTAALQRAEVLRLCAQSAAVLPSDPGQALLMAIAAHRQEPGYRTDTALLAALRDLREVRTLLGHGVELTGAAFHPDGRRAATCARDYTVRIWEIESGEEILRLHGHVGTPNGIVFDGGGRRLASFGWGPSVHLWDADTGRELWRLPHQHVVDSAMFLPDGRRLLTGARDGKARVWDVATGKVAFTLDGHAPGKLTSCRVSPAGDLVVTASEDGTARVWDAGTGLPRRVLQGHSAALTAADLTADGRWVLTAGMDNSARVWSTSGGSAPAVLNGHERWIECAAFSPDGKWIVTGSQDATARLWAAPEGKPTAVLRGHTDVVTSAAFSADSARVVTASEDRTARIWDVQSGRELAALRGHQSGVVTVAFHPGGTRIITGSRDNTARIWDADTRGEEARLVRPAWDRAAVFSGDGSRVAVFGTGRIAEVREAASGELIASLVGHDQGVRAAAFDHEARRLVTGSLDGSARIWDVLSGRELALLQAHKRDVFGVAFSRDGARVGTAAGDHDAAIWDAASGKLEHKLKGHNSGVLAIDFSPDGKLAATASDDQTVRVWQVETGAARKLLRFGTSWLHRVLFDDSGKSLLVASRMNVIAVTDVESGRHVSTLVGHDADLVGAGFAAPDRLITLHADGAAHLWDVQAGSRRLSLRCPEALFREAALDLAGGKLRTEATDGTRRDWPLEPLATALARSPRPTTPYDWARIDGGHGGDRWQDQVDWGRQMLQRTVAIGLRILEHDRANAAALDRLAQDVRATLGFLRQADVRAAGSAAAAASPLAWRDPELVRHSLEVIERLVDCPGSVAGPTRMPHGAEDVYLAALPTPGIVELALGHLDRDVIAGSQARWRLHRGASGPTPGLEWTAVGFDDSGWERAALPVGFGAGSDVATNLGDMQGGYTSVYLRHGFRLDGPDARSRWRLAVRHHGGFVAFINGREVFRTPGLRRAGELLPHDARFRNNASTGVEENEVPVFPQVLRPGENVLAIHGLSRGLDADRFVLGAMLAAQSPPAAERDDALMARVAPLSAGSTFRAAHGYLAARLLARRGRNVEAVAELQLLHDQTPGDARILCRLVEALRASGGAGKADELLRNLLSAATLIPAADIDRVRRGALRILHRADQSFEDYLRAAVWVEQVRRSAPPLPISIPNLRVAGFARVRLGLVREGLELLEGARPAHALLSKGQEDPSTLAFLIIALVRLGRADEARGVFAVLTDPGRTEPWGSSPYMLEAAAALDVPLIVPARP